MFEDAPVFWCNETSYARFMKIVFVSRGYSQFSTEFSLWLMKKAFVIGGDHLHLLINWTDL
jgi:hypothetical protein